MENILTIRTDGGARGNPGPAAIGVVIEKEGKIVHEFGKTIGETTNNVAEYTAVIEALKYIKEFFDKNESPCHSCARPPARQESRNLKIPHRVQDDKEEHQQINFFLDSKLVVEQLNGRFKIKDAKLRELVLQIKMLEQENGGVITYQSIPREQNKRADLLVNQALDQQ